MENQEINLLEEKIDRLLSYCAALKSEKEELKARLREHEESIEALRNQVAKYEDDRDAIRSRINGLLSKIGDIDDGTGGVETAFNEQAPPPEGRLSID